VASYTVPNNARASPTLSQPMPSTAQDPLQLPNSDIAGPSANSGPISLGLSQLNHGMGLKGKGKAPATDLDQHNDDTSSNDRSRDQSGSIQDHVPDLTRNER
jgi:hypothetical protein